MNLSINSKTTGFASPAEAYVDKRLDLNDLIVGNILTTFYFKYKGPTTLGVKSGSILVIDRGDTPKDEDLVLITDKSCFKIRKYNGQEDNLWGKITWVLNKL